MKKKLILETINTLEKQFGKEAIMLMGQKSQQDNDVFPSGSLIIDKILGIGGYPRGRIIEIFGPESSGKTTIALHAISEIQKLGGICAFIDAEHAIDPEYAKRLGVDIDNLILSQPDSGEQALEIVDTLIKTKAIDLIIVDSVAALVPEVELNGEMRENTIGAQARLMSKALRKITSSLNKTNTTLFFINQIREKITSMYGNPETTSGGRALKFYASIRLEVRKISQLGTINNQEIFGNNIRLKVVKNKLSPPFKVGVTEIIFAYGICKYGELIDLASEAKILEKNGSWYKYENVNLAQGKSNMRLLLKNDQKLFQKIYDQIIIKNQKNAL